MKETIKKKKINKDERKIKIILGIMLILFVLTLASFVMLITKLFEKKEEPKVPYVTGIEKNEKLVERLKGKSEFSIKHVNFEAIGDYYVVETDIIANNSNEDKKNKKGLYFVFREYDFNDYVFSFSKNK